MTALDNTPTDLTNCDREPIHTPGAILPHGVMLVVDPDSLEVVQAGGDLAALLGVRLDDLIGKPLDLLFRPEQIALLRSVSAMQKLNKPRHFLDPVLRIMPDHPLDVSLHRSDGALVLEFEAADLADRFAADPLSGVEELVTDYKKTMTLQVLCQNAVERVRMVAQYDRVMVYRFMPDDSGWVIAESCAAGLEPFLGLHYPASDIPQQARALYARNWLRLITQVNYDPTPLMPASNPRTGKPLDMSQAILRDVSPVHREYLRNMGVDASMSISIIREGKLWGLIACHNHTPRILPRHLRAVCELFGSLFSMQLEVCEKADLFEGRLASRMVLQNLMLNLATAYDYADGLTKQSPSLLDYISAGGVDQGGVVVSVNGVLRFLGVCPDIAEVEALVAWLAHNKDKLKVGEGVYATDRLAEVWPDAAGYIAACCGILFISVSDNPSDFIVWFRPEMIGTTSWAGQPTNVVEGGQISPRKSFEIWKETVRGRSAQWTAADIDAAYDLRVSLLHVLRRINVAAQERKRAADRDQLVMAELDHRVKNTLANIQALVRQTSQSAQSMTGFVEGLDGRIRSMAKAHSLLSQSRWESVSITSLVHEELDPYKDEGSHIIVTGADVLLTPKSALSLSLAIHELATNAVKYGALSRAGGGIVVQWQLTEDGIELSWTESGGPSVTPPKRLGFGSTVIERALGMETGGSASVHYLPPGVVCEIFLPNPALAKSVLVAPVRSASLLIAPVKAPVKSDDSYRVLVVEDSFLVAMSLEGFFSDLGWTIVGPASGIDQAMKLARSEKFDVALLDINLDGQMSWDVAAVLRKRGIPFIFSTGYEVANILPEFLAGSVVLGKPYQEHELENQLRQAIADRAADVVG